MVSVTYGGHVFLEGQRHPQAGLIGVFCHRQFLSSFWILVIIRLTVSRIRFSFDLLDRGLFVRPHKGLVSGSRWSFFIGSSPVSQSLQEYLGVQTNLKCSHLEPNISKGHFSPESNWVSSRYNLHMIPLENPHHQMIPIYDFPNGSFYRISLLLFLR